MKNLNKVQLIGNLVKDIEVHAFDNGKVIKSTIAVNESYKDKAGEWQDKTEFVNILKFNPSAAQEKMTKGTFVFAEGKYTTRKWQDKEGKDRWTTEVLLYDLQSLERPAKKNEGLDSIPKDDDLPF